MEVNTKLRAVWSSDINTILAYVNSLPYKIEIKGGITFANNKFYLTFNLPDDNLKELQFGDLD